uniref:Ubiquitin carboxyl-terminal hydrolase 16-like n=1 Tax=Rhizophora mucronata TaxID=61149 RepID=A0A2P2L7B9_RHIMU
MLLAGDLGFSSLVLVVCLVFPVASLVIRRKWRLSVARTEEVRRLLVLASEEAARAELEATISHAAVSVPVSPNNYQCAVCYCPTTTRCARCKSVRYCSGKCQIIHWRQGHKEECQPPHLTYCIDEVGSNSRQKFAKQGKHFVNNDGYESAQIETSPSESALSNSSCSAGVPCMKDDSAIVDPVADTEGTYCTESSGSSFSGFSTSTLRDESSDDVSVSDSISSNEPEGPDGQICSDTAPGIQASILHDVDQTKPSSPNFARLVDSVDSFSTFSKLSQISSHDNCGKSWCATSNSSFQSTNAVFRGSTTSTGKASSACCRRALDSAVSSNDAHGHSAMSSSSGAVNGKLSPSASCASSNCMDKNYSGDSKVSKISELKSESAPPSHTHQPSCPEEALSESKFSSSDSQSHFATGATELPVPNVKMSKVNNVEGGCTTSSNVALFPYDLFVWLYTSNKVEVRPFGLINCGNSCYANAVLQCLAFTPPLVAYLVQGLHSKICMIFITTTINMLDFK